MQVLVHWNIGSLTYSRAFEGLHRTRADAIHNVVGERRHDADQDNRNLSKDAGIERSLQVRRGLSQNHDEREGRETHNARFPANALLRSRDASPS